MDEKSIVSQAISIMSNVTGITKAFDYDETPGKLNTEDLPAAVPIVGPMAHRGLNIPGGKASDNVREAQDFILRIYVVPITQDYDIGDAVSATADFLSPVLDAFDGRPKLVNATGESEDSDDFDFSTAKLDRAFVTGHSGIVVRDYGAVSYFAVEYTLRCDGRRSTSKVVGN